MTKHAFDKLTAITTTTKKQHSPLSILADKSKGRSFLDFWNDILVKPEGIHGPSKLHPFQQKLIQDLQTYRRVAVLASRNMGKSEIALRYGLWLTLSKQTPGNYIFISGVGYQLSRSLCRRAKAMLEPLNVYSDDNSTTLNFAPLKIRWSFYGSDSKGWRGQNNVVYLVCDEAAHFDDSQDWRAVCDTYAIKDSGATIFIITTPSASVDSIAHRLFKEDDTNSLYKHVFLNYRQGVGMMYRPEDIELLKKTSESFPVEYDLQWGYSYEGAVFHESDIKHAIELGKQYNPLADHNPANVTSMAIDFGFGSSPSGICISQ